jgi:hypothetical protein
MKIEVAQPRVEDLFKDFYAVPKFQREYVWQEEQVTALLEDVYDALFDETGVPVDTEYFIGSVVVYPDADGVFQLIDGQQRTTTLFLALCALRDVWRSVDSAAKLTVVEKLLQDDVMDDQGQVRARFRLRPLYDDARDVFEGIGGGVLGPVPDLRALSNSSRNMVKAYEATVDFLARFDGKAAGLVKFFQALTKKVRLVRIETPGVADALRIFETINDRGVGLNAMDLLKNLLFMQASKEQFDQLTAIWKEMIRIIEGPKVREKPLRFLRYYLLSRYADARRAAKPLTEDDLYAWLEERKGRGDVAIDTQPLVFAKALRDAARDYERFVVHPPAALAHIMRLSARARQHMVVMLASPGLTAAELTYLSGRLEALFVAYLLTRQATKALDLIFANAAPRLRELIAQQPPSPSRLQALERFVQSWVEPELSKLSDRLHAALDALSLDRKTMARFVLARVSMHLDDQAGKRPLSVHDYWGYHIEHILPNSPTPEQRQDFDQAHEYDSYKKKLGNLTLLESSINSAIGRDYFADKMSAYSKSDVFMTRALVQSQGLGGHGKMDQAGAKLSNFTRWTTESINVRHSEIKALACDLWKFGLP